MKETKLFSIERQLVMNAYQKVHANSGGAGVDGMTLKEFRKDCKKHLYKLWNQMSSGSYMPPAIRLMEIPKKDGGVRPLGIPTVADRIGQTVVKQLLEPVLEPIFHRDSYGYGVGKSAADAVGKARRRCWNYDWVIDLDIKGFFDNIPHDLLMKAVRKHCDCKWMLLYIERWLVAPLQLASGEVKTRTKGVPQGAVIGQAKLVYCKDSNRRGEFSNITFDFLGYTFMPRQAQNRITKETFANWLPAVSKKAMKSMNEKMEDWAIMRASDVTIQDIAQRINPVIKGWINYYGKFYKTRLKDFLHLVNIKLASWARRKYKNLRTSEMKAIRWLHMICTQSPGIFAHWAFGSKPTVG